MSSPLLQIDGLLKRYNGTAVVDGLSLAIRRGECLGLIGPNGAGKTTTIRMCLGLVGPDAGSIEVFGLPIPQRVREAKQRLGVVTQFDSLDPDFTCAENLRVFARYFGVPRARIDARIPQLLEFAALQSRAGARPADISRQPTLLVALPVLFVTGITFSSIALVFNALARSYDFFTYYFTLVLTPMTFLSGVYFPVDQMPPWLQTVGAALPLTAAVELVRPLVIGEWPAGWLRPLAVLLAYAAAGYWIALVLTRRRFLR